MQQLRTGTGGAYAPLSEILPAARIRSLRQDDRQGSRCSLRQDDKKNWRD
jgi:hypothetical protein